MTSIYLALKFVKQLATGLAHVSVAGYADLDGAVTHVGPQLELTPLWAMWSHISLGVLPRLVYMAVMEDRERM